MRNREKRGWQKMQHGVAIPRTDDQTLRQGFIDAVKKERIVIWRNDIYTVHERRQAPKDNGLSGDLVWLSIHRHDRQPIRDWRHLQKIKNDIIGPEEEAIELFPAESRLVDTSNEYHLWCIIGLTFPFGFGERLVSEGGFDIGAKQRPWHPDDRPADCRDITREDIEKYLKEST